MKKFYSFLKIIFSVFIVSFSIANTSAIAQDNLAFDEEYKFTVKGHDSRKVPNKADFALMESAKYAIKKKHKYFALVEAKPIEIKGKAKSYSRFGSTRKPKPKLRTEITIQCYNNMPSDVEVYDAKELRQEIKDKYK